MTMFHGFYSMMSIWYSPECDDSVTHLSRTLAFSLHSIPSAPAAERTSRFTDADEMLSLLPVQVLLIASVCYISILLN